MSMCCATRILHHSSRPAMIVCIGMVLLRIVYGDLPISWPGTNVKRYPITDLGPVPYNMIDANPSCYEYGTCPMFPPGGKLSSFPNSEEKYQAILHNLHRMWGNYTLFLPYAKWKFGANKNGKETKYCPPGKGCAYCGDTRSNLVPLYWYSPANQAARFKQYDEKSCDQAWYSEDGNNAHVTCGWVLDEYGGGSHCDLFGGSCEFGPRGSGFCHEDRCWFETEGICGGNTCVTDGHCEPIFAQKYDYQGTGFVEGMNGVATVYSRWTVEVFYVLPSGAHFDERMTIVEEDYNPDGKYFTLMLEYFDANHTQKPDKCWSLYDGMYHEMNLLVSDDLVSGTDYDRVFGYDAYSAMFTTNHLPPTQCQPYAFICKTTKETFWRLPEEGDYYFGTEWIDWVWSDYAEFGDGYLCQENHYYYDGSQWVVNGYPNLDRCDIWFYQNQSYSECIGCNDLNQLDCWSECIYSDFDSSKCSCDTITGPDYGDEYCVGTSPTPRPTLQSDAPTPSPTPAPTSQTPSPTPAPTPSPTPSPTPAPTPAPISAPTPAPTSSTTDPTPSPTSQTQSPGIPPTASPTPSPTTAPTDQTESPSSSPTPSPTPCPTPAPTDASESPTKSPTASPLRASETVSPTSSPTTTPTKSPTASPLPASETPDPTPDPTVDPIESGTGATEEEDEYKDIPRPHAGGGVVAGIVIGFVCMCCLISWVYWRKHIGKPWYPTKEDIRVVGIRFRPVPNQSGSSSEDSVSSSDSSSSIVIQEQELFLQSESALD